MDMNYHCLVTMNCVGVGNSRIHFLFMVLVFAVCALFLVLTLSVEHTVHCPDSKGMVSIPSVCRISKPDLIVVYLV